MSGHDSILQVRSGCAPRLGKGVRSVKRIFEELLASLILLDLIRPQPRNPLRNPSKRCDSNNICREEKSHHVDKRPTAHGRLGVSAVCFHHETCTCMSMFRSN